MKAATKREATRIAFFGARKMDALGYRYERLDVWNWEVTSPSGNLYNVGLYESGDTFCGCKFFEENASYGICKHVMRAKWLREDAARAEEEAEEADYWDRRAEQEAEARFWADEALIKQAMRDS